MHRLFLHAILAVVSAAAQPTGTISGVVRDAGTGTSLAGATVYANRNANGPETTTDTQGRFAFRGLEAGQHRITAYAPSERGPGFGAYATKRVTLASGQELTSIDFLLRGHGEISGRILDAKKEPVPDVWVFLIAREYSLGALRYVFASAETSDDQGNYFLKRGVESGRAYLVMAAKRTIKLSAISEAPANPKLRKPAVVPTYYPGTSSIEGAQPLVLRAGERREGVDLILQRSPAFCIEGVLQDPKGPQSLAFWIADRRPTSGASGDGAMFMMSPNGVTAADGKIRICDLYPGEYQLTVFSAVPGPDGPALFGWQPLAITDSDVTRVSVAAPMPVSTTGEVVWEGPPPDPPISGKLSVALVPLTRSPFRGERSMSSIKVSIPGSFSFGGVLLDEYSFRIYAVPSVAYIKDITYAGRSIRYEPFRPGSAIGDASLRFILAGDGGTLSAKVADKDGNPVADSRVIVMPASVQTEAVLADAMIQGQTDQNGMWTSNRIAPGKYYVLASETPVDKSPESIGKLWRTKLQAKEIEVGPKATVEVTLSPATIQ